MYGDEIVEEVESTNCFVQVSVGVKYSCGITCKDGNILCWGDKMLHGIYPQFMTGPFKQVTVGGAGVCAIYGEEGHISANIAENSLVCWGNAKQQMPEHMPEEWDQILVGDFITCGITMQSDVKCWGRSIANRIPSSIIAA